MPDRIAKSKEIETLCARFYDSYDDALVSQRDKIYRKEMAKHAGESAAKQIAHAFCALLESKAVRVFPYDLLAGQSQHVNVSASVPIVMDETFDPRIRPNTRFDVEREIDCYKQRRAEELAPHERDVLSYFSRGINSALYKRWANGHVIAGYDRVVKEGYGAIEKRIRAQLETEMGEKKDYLEALLLTVQAAQKYILRYALAARQTREETAELSQVQALQRIEDACLHISTEPAATFFEAVQGVWLLHEMLTLENLSGSMSLGRLDQILFPFYEKEKAAGSLDFEQAGDLIEALWLKLASLIQGFQNVTVGGCDMQGNSVANDITILCIRASRKLAMDQPLLSLRYTSDMDDRYWKEAQALIEQGGGFPALFNDKVIIRSREQMGVAQEDAWDYGIVGCVEPSICGREYSNTEEMRANWSKVMELMLNDGVCTMTGIHVGLAHGRELEDIKSFDEFYAWFREELVYALELGMTACNMLDSSYPFFFPSPMLSLTMAGCVENAQDVSAVGTRYNFSTVNGCGMANAIDSLLAIKRAVFDEKKITLPQFADALRSDFAGYEDLYAYVTSHCAKFGNDQEEPDRLMREVVDLVCNTVNEKKNGRNGRFQTGLYTVDDHAVMGKRTGALPEGRKRGISLANAISPVQGADRNGPTATMNSVTKFDHTRLGNGMVLDLKFNPGFFKKPRHGAAFRYLVGAYFDNGGMEVQFNVVSRDTLIAAQKEPHKYRNLVVRVSGFSAYFVTLDAVLQDEIIKRTEYNAI